MLSIDEFGLTETGHSCMSTIRQFLKPQSFTHAFYRCNKTVFFEPLAAVVTTLLAQVVLTLRFVLFSRDKFLLVRLNETGSMPSQARIG